jgi:hypothetical protein
MPRQTTTSKQRHTQPHQTTSYTGAVLPRPPTHTPPVQSPAVVQNQGQYEYPSIGQIVKQGFGFGIGSSIANRLVSSVLGPPQQTIPRQQQEMTQVSSQETKREPVYSVAYNQCVLEGGNHEVCKQYLDKSDNFE